MAAGMSGIVGMTAPIIDAVMLDEAVLAHLAHIHVAVLAPAEVALVEVDGLRPDRRSTARSSGRAAAWSTEKTSLLASGSPSGGIGSIR